MTAESKKKRGSKITGESDNKTEISAHLKDQFVGFSSIE